MVLLHARDGVACLGARRVGEPFSYARAHFVHGQSLRWSSVGANLDFYPLGKVFASTAFVRDMADSDFDGFLFRFRHVRLSRSRIRTSAQFRVRLNLGRRAVRRNSFLSPQAQSFRRRYAAARRMANACKLDGGVAPAGGGQRLRNYRTRDEVNAAENRRDECG